jgi:hypothetical protein
MKIVTGTVKFTAGKIITTQYGQRQNAVVTLENGEEIKIWQEPNGVISAWQKGQKVQVIETAKGWSVPDNAARPVATQVHSTEIINSASTKLPDRETRQKMLAYIDFQVTQYTYIYTKIGEREEFQGLPLDALKDIATTIFIQNNRAFSL